MPIRSNTFVSFRVVYVTEGALKADIAHALKGRTFVATVGANNSNGLDELFAFLHRNGTEEIIEAEDIDKYRYRKTQYRGLRKQTAKLNFVFALANLILADRPCLVA